MNGLRVIQPTKRADSRICDGGSCDLHVLAVAAAVTTRVAVAVVVVVLVMSAEVVVVVVVATMDR